ncbi:MAG: DUF1579 family protein [Geminicoccaceae bacterium]
MTNPIRAMEALAPFVGIWNTEGEIRAKDGEELQPLVATDTYEWLPGKGFLLHSVDARLGGHVTRSIEIIGWDEDAGGLFSTSYDDKGATSRFRCALEDHAWKIDGQGLRLRGDFDQKWNELTGTWEIENGGDWSPWMDIKLTKVS